MIATSMGGFYAGATAESMLAVALTLRGARVEILLCDEFLPACQQAQIGHFADISDYGRSGPTGELCAACYRPARAMYEGLGLKVHRYSDSVTRAERDDAERIAAKIPHAEIATFRFRDMAVGEHALAGALRFFAKGVLDETSVAEAVLRRYLAAAILTACAADRLFTEGGFEAACFNHGIYVPQGLIGEAARARGVRVVNWNPAYRRQCFIFSHGTTYHHTLMDEPTSVWSEMPWTEKMEARLTDYLQSRWHGTQDWIWFHEKPQFEIAEIARKIGVDFSKPCIGLLTNVVWDAQLHYPANAFPNMLEWIMETIRYFARRPELQLVIRVHPAEIRGTVRSRQLVAEEIARAFPELPPNVFVIAPDSDVSTYAAMLQCDSVIIYGTKTGVELTSMGVPVVVAGEAWIRNKGVTLDARSAAHYFELLDRLPLGKRMDDDAVRRARKYAFHFFFRRMIPLPMMQTAEGKSPFRVAIQSIGELRPGANKGLDVICDGIISGSPFVYPAEEDAVKTAEVAP
ncbi:MAG: hypothetical protein K8R23_13665 [Chthoniobacter sp.]|nr:hypothetical protein [Chthoniobacter sp.]